MSIFHCMVGIAGAGKSTLALKLAEADDCVIICPDQLREQLTGSAGDQSKDKEVWELAYKQVEDAILLHQNIIFNATSVRRFYRKRLLNIFEKFKATSDYLLVCHYLPISTEDAINRQTLRARKVPTSVIIRQQHQLEYPSADEGWDCIYRHTIKGDVICDYPKTNS